ncbi:MAG: thermonuclease family protein [Clostridia bacterium]|nr:thermonuclease family protein [Clostridia bacterium]
MGKVIFVAIIIIFDIIFLMSGFIKENFNNTQNPTTVVNEISNDLTNEQIDTSKFQEAYVKRVVDGDTIIATINNEDYRVRLIGINTPESTTEIEPYGKEASNYTSSILTGKTIYLEKDVRNTDKYNRLLRYVWLEIPNEISEDEIRNKLFNADLLIKGYAELFTYPPDVKYVNYFKTFENEARNNCQGLWEI